MPAAFPIERFDFPSSFRRKPESLVAGDSSPAQPPAKKPRQDSQMGALKRITPLPLLLALLVAMATMTAVACAGDPPAPTLAPVTATAVPTLTPTTAPTPTSVPTPTATATPVPTPTPTPTPTDTPVPTATAIPTATPTATPAPTATPLPDGPLVRIGDALYLVDLATTPAQITQGLSGRPSLGIDRAMLFVYDRDAPRTFWMPDMHFPLDMVWIRSDCTVAGVTADVPHPTPDTPRSDLPLYPSDAPVRFVLEINAGQAAQHGIIPGTPVTFAGAIAGMWGC